MKSQEKITNLYQEVNWFRFCDRYRRYVSLNKISIFDPVSGSADSGIFNTTKFRENALVMGVVSGPRT